MIVCPYNPSVLMTDTGDAFYCSGCPDCRLLTSLYPDTEFIFTKEENDK